MALGFFEDPGGYADLPECRDRMPVIRRARDYHLYDRDGNRYLDIYLNNGRCLLGHRPEGVFGVLKNALSKGGAAEYPSVEQSRFMKHVSKVFPDYRQVRLYRSSERAMEALAAFFGDKSPGVTDPLTADNPGPVRLWRPFAPEDKDKPEAILPIIPFPMASAPVVVCFKAGNPPPSDSVPPFIAAALSRALGSLQSFGRQYNEDLWKHFDAPALWSRKGPYLVFRVPPADYFSLFEGFLHQGILIPPCRPAVGIVPGSFTPGEIAPIIKEARIRGG